GRVSNVMLLTKERRKIHHISYDYCRLMLPIIPCGLAPGWLIFLLVLSLVFVSNVTILSAQTPSSATDCEFGTLFDSRTGTACANVREGEPAGNTRVDYFVNFELPMTLGITSGVPSIEIYNMAIEQGLYTPKVTAQYVSGSGTDRWLFHASNPPAQFADGKYEGNATFRRNGAEIINPDGQHLTDNSLTITGNLTFDKP
ncbi:MAG: hypothetical protein M3Q34_03245, partial [bacterium]|nr:hypothetical protein [bacterium]